MVFKSSFISETMLEMSWVEIEEAAKKEAVVFFPIAVVEEHGPHMSVSVDIFMSYLLARRARELLQERGIDSIIAPPFYWGINGTTLKLPGSFYVSKETAVAMLVDIFMSLKNWGFKKIIAIPGHGEKDHLRAIDEALKIVHERTGEGAFMIVPSIMTEGSGIESSAHTVIVEMPGLTGDDPDALVDTHAGMIETSMMLQYYPDHVDHELYPKLPPSQVKASDYARWEEGGDFFAEVSPQGYLGAPALASADLGKAIIDAVVEASLKYVLEKLNQS